MKTAKDYSKWLETSHLKSGIKQNSVKGGASTFSAQIISFALTTITTAVLARLLSPADFGLVAMVTAITGFIMMFRDFGLSSAVIQKDVITHQQVSTLFWINVLVGIVLSIIIMILAPIVASFYKDERLVWITLIISSNAILAGFSSQHRALLNRQMKFNALAMLRIVPFAASSAVSIVLGLMGFNYWAIVIGGIANNLVTLIIVWYKCDWRPSKPQWRDDVKDMIKFGVGVSGFNLVNYFSRNLDNILIGRFIGATALGLYSKAYQLLMLPITQIRDPLNSVGIPALSALQKEKREYRNYYNKYLFFLAFISMPVVIFLGIFSDGIITIVLGKQWLEASRVFQILALSAFIQPVAGTRGMVLISMGHSTKYFYWGVFNSIFVIIGFIVGIQFGLHGLAYAYAIVNYALLIPSLSYSFKGTPLSLLDFFKGVFAPAIASLISGAIVYYLDSLELLHVHELVIIILFGLLFVIIYISLFMITSGTRKHIEDVMDVGKILLTKMKKKK